MEIRGDGAAMTLYEAVGGARFFEELVGHFYAGVEGDDRIRHLYPDDLSMPRHHTALFLMQYWGGPATYSDERGHPRLRMRHAPFVIGQLERDVWMEHMGAAIDTMDPADEIANALREYFTMAADHMINSR
jgi:hemoglobin